MLTNVTISHAGLNSFFFIYLYLTSCSSEHSGGPRAAQAQQPPQARDPRSHVTRRCCPTLMQLLAVRGTGTADASRRLDCMYRQHWRTRRTSTLYYSVNVRPGWHLLVSFTSVGTQQCAKKKKDEYCYLILTCSCVPTYVSKGYQCKAGLKIGSAANFIRF